MVKEITTAALILGFVIVSNIAHGAAAVKPIKWESVYGLKFPGVNGYIDINHRKMQTIKGREYGSGEILFSYTEPVVVLVNGEITLVRGIVRAMVVECDTGSSMPLFDLFYAETYPAREDKPVDGADYREREDMGSTLSIRSPVFAALCPKFI
jgi:hypothetical protein